MDGLAGPLKSSSWNPWRPGNTWLAAVQRAFPALLACATLTACTVNPVTGQRELELVNTAQQINIGEQQYLPALCRGEQVASYLS